MSEYNIKPVYVMNQEGVSDLEKRAVLNGAHELIGLGGAEIEVKDFGVWRLEDYKNSDDTLKENKSVDWYVEEGRTASRNKTQLNASRMLDALHYEPWRMVSHGGKDHYDILVLHEDMYSGDTNFIIGLARQGIGTVLSVNRFRCLTNREIYECVKTETMHELGHAFGLVSKSRTKNVENQLGMHCTNICIMRQGMTVPNDWLKITDQRLRYGALCKECDKELKDFFRPRPRRNYTF